MKPIANYDSAKEEAKKMGNVIPKIPVGGYVLKIESVRYEKGTDGKSDKIVLAYDVAEGEEKGFFKKQFDAITDENKKWKGVATIYVPDEDGNNNDWSVKKFAQTMNYFEESNAGFVWDWDEKKLKGKLIGGIFGELFVGLHRLMKSERTHTRFLIRRSMVQLLQKRLHRQTATSWTWVRM